MNEHARVTHPQGMQSLFGNFMGGGAGAGGQNQGGNILDNVL